MTSRPFSTGLGMLARVNVNSACYDLQLHPSPLKNPPDNLSKDLLRPSWLLLQILDTSSDCVIEKQVFLVRVPSTEDKLINL